MADNDGILVQSTSAHPAIYMDLFKPIRYKNEKGVEGAPRFKVSFVMDPESDDFKAIKKAAITVAKAKFGTLERNDDEPKLKWPWMKVDNYIARRNRKKPGSGDKLAWAAGKMLVAAITGEEYPPGLAIIENKEVVDLDSELMIAKHKAKFYSGVECYFIVNVKAYGGGNDGTCAYISTVLSTNKGEKRGGGGARSAKEAFKGIVGQHSAEDPTDGIDDDEDY
jgi:hypothetical protein